MSWSLRKSSLRKETFKLSQSLDKNPFRIFTNLLFFIPTWTTTHSKHETKRKFKTWKKRLHGSWSSRFTFSHSIFPREFPLFSTFHPVRGILCFPLIIEGFSWHLLRSFLTSQPTQFFLRGSLTFIKCRCCCSFLSVSMCNKARKWRQESKGKIPFYQNSLCQEKIVHAVNFHLHQRAYKKYLWIKRLSDEWAPQKSAKLIWLSSQLRWN